MAAGAGLSLLSARKLWRALGFPNLGDEDVAFTERDQAALSTIVDLVRAGKLTEEAAISVTRAIGQMTDRMVVWQIEALVEDMVHEQGVTDAVARKRLVSELPPSWTPSRRCWSIPGAASSTPGSSGWPSAPRPGCSPARRAAKATRTTRRCRSPAPSASPTWSPTRACPGG